MIGWGQLYYTVLYIPVDKVLIIKKRKLRARSIYSIAIFYLAIQYYEGQEKRKLRARSIYSIAIF